MSAGTLFKRLQIFRNGFSAFPRCYPFNILISHNASAKRKGDPDHNFVLFETFEFKNNIAKRLFEILRFYKNKE